MLTKFSSLSEKLKSKFLFNHEMGHLTWFKTGGKAKVFIIVENENELEILINSLYGYNYYIMGVGSNLLIRDKGYNGAIIKLGKGFNELKIEEDFIQVGSSILDINLSKFAKNNSIKNFEFFSGIPGTIGGAIKMNSGCFGFETKDILKKIKFFDINGIKNEINADKLDLKYRSSNLKDTDIITSTKFRITYGETHLIKDKINSIKLEREKKQPLKERTSGSTFKNPPDQFAAELIDKAGCRGLEIGDAAVSLKHANFLINKGRATAEEIEQLGKKIIDKVFDKFNILLDWEIKVLGD